MMCKGFLSAHLLTVLLSSGSAFAIGQDAGVDAGAAGETRSSRGLSEARTLADVVDVLQGSVVFLGNDQAAATGAFSGSGVILTYENFFYLATARHVAEKSQPTHAFVRQYSGSFALRDLAAVRSRRKIDWVFHLQPDVDIAVIPFEFDQKTDNISVIPFSDGFVPKASVLPSLDALILSYQPNVALPKGMRPLLRRAMVSATEERYAILDGFAFPGNSGGPVFARPDFFREFRAVGANRDPLGGKLIGIVSSYVTYLEPAFSPQTGRARVVFEENTGLMTVFTVQAFEELFASQAFQAQHTRLKAQAQ